MYPCKVVSREINHSINCMYYRRLFGAKWKKTYVVSREINQMEKFSGNLFLKI